MAAMACCSNADCSDSSSDESRDGDGADRSSSETGLEAGCGRARVVMAAWEATAGAAEVVVAVTGALLAFGMLLAPLFPHPIAGVSIMECCGGARKGCMP